jgi:hypothetical protein
MGMREGYWINYRVGRVELIDEHQLWVRRPGHAARLGIPQEAVAEFTRFDPATDRDEFLRFLMGRAPVMRVRGHGASVTFEFISTCGWQAPLEAIASFLADKAGPRLGLNIVDLGVSAVIAMDCARFIDVFSAGGAMAVAQAAVRIPEARTMPRHQAGSPAACFDQIPGNAA